MGDSYVSISLFHNYFLLKQKAPVRLSYRTDDYISIVSSLATITNVYTGKKKFRMTRVVYHAENNFVTRELINVEWNSLHAQLFNVSLCESF